MFHRAGIRAPATERAFSRIVAIPPTRRLPGESRLLTVQDGYLVGCNRISERSPNLVQ